MKKIKNVVFILALFLCFNGCEKNPTEEEPKQNNGLFTVEQAQAWFGNEWTGTLNLKSGNVEKARIGIKPDWCDGFTSQNDEVEVVEVGLLVQGNFSIAEEASYKEWKTTKNQKMIRSLTRMVFLKYKSDGRIAQFLMTIVGDKEYHDKKSGRLEENSYLTREKHFSGCIYYHDIEGEFVNGWKYEKGKLVATIQTLGEGLPIHLKSASYCVTTTTYYFYSNCYTWRQSYNTSNIVIDFEECGSTYTELVATTECVTIDVTSGGGGTPGGYTPPTEPCTCTSKCPVCGKCLDANNLKSAILPGDGTTTTTTTDPCTYCTGHPKVVDLNLPCPGDPIKCPSIASSGASGQAGGMFGCVRIGESEQCNNVKKYHDGVDIESSLNQDVYSMYSGTVIDRNASFSPGEYAANSYGNYITIRHTGSDGTSFDIKYNHLNSVGLNNGDSVATGQIIGKSGDTGNAASISVRPHVHIQIFKNNISIDPCGYFATSFSANGTISNPCNL